MNSSSSPQLAPFLKEIQRSVRRGAYALLITGFIFIGLPFSSFLLYLYYFSISGVYVTIFLLIFHVGAAVLNGLLVLLGCLALRCHKRPLHHLTY